ncbi:MAG: BrnT family toxin [Desulfamplus sp.]|nr:BrnT family toxin [Desulfamplus sp.]
MLLGTSSMLRTLVVCHCYRENDTVIRIISARKANKQEEFDYRGQ